MSAAVRYLDRESGELQTEAVYGERELRLLYETWWGRILAWLLFKRRLFSVINGVLKKRARSRKAIPHFIESLGVNSEEAELPVDRYASLDAFFTRRLKPGARAVDRRPDVLVSPADGRLLVFPRLNDHRLRVKNCDVTLEELVGAPLPLPQQSLGGFVVRLAPVDYHRFHFPFGGSAGDARLCGQHLHAIHPIALNHASSFRNRRMVTEVVDGTNDRYWMIEVGAMTVGSVEQTYRSGPVTKGDEKGMFHFGGSTVIVLFESPRLELDPDLIEASARGLETLVRMGSRIGRLGEAPRETSREARP